ncbi:SRPBCC family protein [Actinomadura barringtoniae]|uniref:SRPBCC family protein n=1 Tax=Actinomadura barringtoniae TaxID=1427535 RepID=A0A939PS96_9ACTN|nr:SRPBCC family protein [Actinomadura barringtoniae]MBO2453841.1 SRPBCC family protein [Actinomadura barringtoniae]
MKRYPVFLGVLAVGWYAVLVRPQLLRWGATADEAAEIYPGDELVPDASEQTTMAATLPAPPDQVWPWLVQMGHERGGWYSWDRLDNAGHPSAERIDPDWQELKAGERLITSPSGNSWFTVAVLDRPRTLILRADLQIPSGRPFDPRGVYPPAYTEGIWAFHLRPTAEGGTRLVVRTRGRGRPRIADRLAAYLFGEPAHFIMQTRQFQNLRRRVRRAQVERPDRLSALP